VSAIGTPDEVAARLTTAMGLVSLDVGPPAHGWTPPGAHEGGAQGSGPASETTAPGPAEQTGTGSPPEGRDLAGVPDAAVELDGGDVAPTSEGSVDPGEGPPLTAEDAHGTVCIDVPRELWSRALTAAHEALGLDMLDWLSAVDEPDAEPPRVDVVAHLVDSRSTGQRAVESGGIVRLLLRTSLPADHPTVASATSIWPGAAWHERETHEMFGVEFTGFEDGTGMGLRPLLLPDGFEGTPLRKSFVLAARASKPWPGAKEPGESDTHASPSRRRLLPPGVPDPSWGPREP
jgi:NADH-quinone oxidoreductase subunit C